MGYGIQTLKYEDGQEIHSAVMGDGSVGITDILINDDGFVGVAIYDAPDNKIVGGPIDESKRGHPVTDLDIKFQMLFDNVDSIDVIIERLGAAKKSLLDSQDA
jgi:hypothetical protein